MTDLAARMTAICHHRSIAMFSLLAAAAYKHFEKSAAGDQRR